MTVVLPFRARQAPPAVSAPVRHDRERLYLGERQVDLDIVGDAGADHAVFLHGWGLSSRSYLPCLRALAAHGWQVYAPSLPGFGRSDRLPVQNSGLHGYAQHMGEAIAALGLDGPTHLVGHSFGGGISLRIATLHPELVASLTLVCPVGGAASGAAPWWRMLAGLAGDASTNGVGGFLSEFLPAASRSPLSVTVSGLAARRADLVRDLRAVRERRIPVHLVLADRDDIVRPGALTTCAPGVRLSVVPGTHGWLLADPARFADVVSADDRPALVRTS